MNRVEIEKSLKRFLKKKVAYTLSVLVSFLITGGLSFGAEVTSKEIIGTQKLILNKIKIEREKITEKLTENKEALKDSELELNFLIKEADFYSQPLQPSYGFSIIGNHSIGDSNGKDWKGSVRKNTSMDMTRSLFDESLGKKQGSNLSSGWINMDDNYSLNTNVYDAVSKLFILPVVKPPVIIEPTVPTISFTVPTPPTIITITNPNIGVISIPIINVNPILPTLPSPPSQMPSPNAPGNINISVNEPNINVEIGEITVVGPGELEIPELEPPNIVVNLNPVVPPAIILPDPIVESPRSPTAPDFTIFISGGRIYQDIGRPGINYFDPNRYVPLTSAESGYGTTANLASGQIRRQTDVNLSVFDFVNLSSGTSSKGKIFSYRGGDGVAYTGYENVVVGTTFTERAATYGGGQPILGSVPVPGYVAGSILPTTYIHQKNNWLINMNAGGNATGVVDNIHFILGGENAPNSAEQGVLFMRNDGENTTISNTIIDLYGKTVLIVDILPYPSSLKFVNTQINIKGDQNSLFVNEPFSDIGSFLSPEENTKNGNWGVPSQDVTSKGGILGKVDLNIDTKKNAVFVIQSNGSYRWNGAYDLIGNPENFLVYNPLMGGVKFTNKDLTDNTKGTFYFNGTDNVGAWINKYTPDRTKYIYNSGMSPDEAPMIDLGQIMMNGDSNVGMYFAGHTTRPDFNGIYQGRLPVDFKIGTSLNGTSGSSQTVAGNTDGDAGKTSGNVALFVSSGQRVDLTVANGYFPATTSQFTSGATDYFPGQGIGSGVQIGYPDLNTAAHVIKNLEITDYKVEFGKYSKNNIAIVAKNGSIVELNPAQTVITDGLLEATPDSDRAEGTILAFAEGVWFNPRVAAENRAPDDGQVHTDGKVVIDGTSGQKYVPEYGSSVIIHKPIEMGSKGATAAFAKDGAKIETKGITIYGEKSTGVFATGTKEWLEEGAKLEQAAAGGGTTAQSVITVDGDITLIAGNDNKGIVAMSGAKGDGAIVTVEGDVTVVGLGAYVEGKNSKINIKGTNSTLTSGSEGSLVALNGGTLEFGGGTLEHNTEDQLAFYSSSAGDSKLSFNGPTILNISKGIVFYGKDADFIAAPGVTGRYNGMENLTVNLTDDGVNLGVFEDANVIWNGSTSYANGLILIPKAKAINIGNFWYESSLDGGTLSIATDVNRDNISSGTIAGDGFNDITMERKEVTLESGKNIVSLKGNGILLGSNSKAISNTESGYTIKGNLDISHDAGTEVVAIYTSYGHINIDTLGKIVVSEGIGAYGVNGSKIDNKGKIEIKKSDETNQGKGIVILATNASGGVADSYGKNSGKTGNWGEVINTGEIAISGTHGIGIYMENNHNSALKSEMVITNTAPIELGDSGTGIAIKSSNTTNLGGTLNLIDSGNNGGKDIKVGKKGIGVYAQNSDVIFHGNYGIVIKENGVALQLEGNSIVKGKNSSDKLTIEYDGTSGVGNTAIGIAFQGTSTTDKFTNDLNITVENTQNAETIVALYGIGSGTLENNGEIEVKSTGAYGILSDGVDIVNTGKITVGDSAVPVSGAVGIYAKGASITANGGDINIIGNGDSVSLDKIYPIGIYAESYTDATGTGHGGNIVISSNGTAMNISGNSGIGIYMDDKAGTSLLLTNSSDIDLTDSSTLSDRKLGIFLANASNVLNTTSGEINVGKNNIGIYNKDSILTNSGIINVLHNEAGTQNIGIHNAAESGNFKFTNQEDINVQGVSNIGISLATLGANKGEIVLNGGDIKVTATSLNTTPGNMPIGIYGKGNNIEISTLGTSNKIVASSNSVGIYLEGNDTSKISGDITIALKSDTAGTMGIGAYYKGGSYGATGTITLSSDLTAMDGTGNPVRPIGLFYGTDSTKNGQSINISTGSGEVIGIYAKGLSSFANSGNIDINAKGIGAYFVGSNVTNSGTVNVKADEAYGLYFKGGVSSQSGIITVDNKKAVGVIITETGGKFTNDALISSNAISSIGVYAENNGTFINDGTLNSTLASAPGTPGAPVIEGSIGAFAKGGTITNNGTINSEYLGLYGKDGATINTTGTITVSSGVGILVESLSSVSNLNGGTISGTVNGITGVVAKDTGIINLNGTNISLTGIGTVGIVLDTGALSTLTSGNITVGTGGTGIYATDSALTLSGYTGIISMGNKGIGIYSNDSTLSQGTLNVNYTGTDTGVGIYYEGTNPVTNQVSVNHTGINLVNIYGKGVSLTNTAAQSINENGIGIYAIDGADISNQGILTLSGENTIGIYLADTTSKISEIGTINGANLTANNNKIGVYVADGDIVGNTDYNFGVSGGIGMYLKKLISYTGTMFVSGDSNINNRTIGIYVDPTITTGTLGTKIDVTGANAIGIYLASETTTPSASNITYNGEIKITSTSTVADRGIGVLLAEDTGFTLGTGGKIEIGGQNNIGFFVKKGATLSVSGGTVINSPDGIFAYLEDGILNFTTGSTINIDYANVIVSGNLGSITNDTNITVGTTGLQGDNGATITNSLSGTITGTVVNAKAMVGTGLGTVITNDGTINLTGDSSIGMYVTSGAIGSSSGQISVGKKSTAYYASGGILNISGTATVGEESTLFYADGGDINYTGANIVMGNNSIALALRNGNSNVDFGSKEIETGIKGTGIFIDGSGDITNVINLGKMKLQNGSTGIFIDNDVVVTTGIDIDLIGSESIGIYNKNGTGNINYTGKIDSSAASNKGIINTGTGITTNSGTIKLVGVSSVGIYAENGSIVNNFNIEVANGSTLGSAVGIYGKSLSLISNTGDIKIGEEAIGIYGENVVSILNSNTITGTGNKNTGIYGVSTNVQNTGTITLKDSSNGIYVNNGIINNTGNISVGGISSSGIYGGGTTSITHSGNVTIGDNSTGIATKSGAITVSSSATITAGKNSTHIYTESGTATNNSDLTLSDHSIGMYTKSGSMVNNAKIVVGKSTVISGTTPEISVGMATESGTIENSNSGHIIVSHDKGVGMVANKGGTGINKGTIDVNGNDAYGMQATTFSTLINDGTININGTNSRGIAATNDSIVVNNGTITVNGASSEGIYVDYRSTVDNKGTITVNGAGTGIFIGQGGEILNEGTITVVSGSGGNSTIEGSGGLTNVGDIVIDGGQVMIDGIVITNGGTITVNGALDFGTISLGGVSGNIGTINADSFNDGKIIILPDVTQGSNHEVYTVQYLNGLLNEPNQGSLEAISQSVTWIAKLEKDDNDPNLVKIIMVKIPYKKILAGTDAFEFGKGLDELYAGAANKELEMFDFLDQISNKDELGATFDNELRGNVYSNVQTRMLDINEVFNSTYESLKANKYYARETLKIGAIMSGGEVRNKKAGVEDYDLQSLGLMILQESDSLKYERNYNWSVGFAETKFDFDLGSKEKVYSINGGIGLEDYIKNSRSIKYYTRGELGINHHTTDRKISLGNESYENTGKFWSGTVEWKNKLRYEVPLINNNVNIGLFGTFNLGYGKFQDFQEKGDGIELEVESKDMYIVRPGIGADISYKKNTKVGKFSIVGKVSADYELGEVYDGANRAKIKGTTAGFYELEEPKKLKEIFKVGIEAKYETEAGHSIGLEVMREEGSTEKTKYGLNLMYKF